MPMVSKTSSIKFCRGDLVWGKVYSFPFWPAIVIDANDCGRDNNTKDKLWLFWFGESKVSEIGCDRVKDFKEEYRNHFKKGSGKKFINSVEVALNVLSQSHKQNFPNSSCLFKWAADGFKTQLHSFPKKITELPGLVLEALKKKEFQRKDSDDEDENCEKIENVVPDLLKRVKQLEDICISCCKPNVRVVMQHPWFVGGICKICKKNIEINCKVPFGCSQEHCAICGQGGTIIICCKSTCLRSYCDLCIEYLAPKGSYMKILKEASWSCYLCKPDSRVNCFIQPRMISFPKEDFAMSVPEAKLPINVIAHSDIILSVLREKHFSIGEFATEPVSASLIDDKDNYMDFTFKEFRLISADLVCGSYFTDPSKLEDSNEDIQLLFAHFYNFLCRLDNARLYKPTVFFIFIFDGELDNHLVQKRFIRFLEIEPVFLKVGKKGFYLWSNIPNCCSVSKVLQGRKFHDISEAQLFAAVIKLLSKYFKLN